MTCADFVDQCLWRFGWTPEIERRLFFRWPPIRKPLKLKFSLCVV